MDTLVLPESSIATRPPSSAAPPTASAPPNLARLRRVVAVVYLSQMALQATVVAAIHNAHVSFFDTLLRVKSYVWLFVLAALVSLFLLYHKRIAYPRNMAVLSVYTTSLSVILAAIDLHYNTKCCLFVCIFAFGTMSLLVGASTLWLLRDRTTAIGTLVTGNIISAIVNFVMLAPSIRLPDSIFAGAHAVATVFLAWAMYLHHRILQRSAKRAHHSSGVVVIYYTDVVLALVFLVSLAFSCVAFEGCACCGASDDIPGAVDLYVPMANDAGGGGGSARSSLVTLTPSMVVRHAPPATTSTAPLPVVPHNEADDGSHQSTMERR